MNATSTLKPAGDPLPLIWPGLCGIDAEGPYLAGARCTACGHTAFQIRRICPSCWAAGTMIAAPIGRKGVLYSYTVIHQLPPGFDAPFAVGYLDLPEQPRIFAHIDNTPEALQIGRTLALSIEPLKRSETGTLQYGPRYRAAPDAIL